MTTVAAWAGSGTAGGFAIKYPDAQPARISPRDRATSRFPIINGLLRAPDVAAPRASLDSPSQCVAGWALHRTPGRRLPGGARRARRRVLHPGRVERRAPAAPVVLSQLKVK